MRKRRLLNTVLTMALGSSLVTGCGSLMNRGQSSASGQIPSFKDSRSAELVTPIAKFNAIQADPNVYTQVKVFDQAGHQVVLNAKEQPLLFEAYWCPHCQRTLVSLNQHRSTLHAFPTLVSMGFVPGTTLNEAIALSDTELNTFHITNVKVYYLLDPTEAKQLIHSYPTMVFPYHNQLNLLVGEHTYPVWQQALNQL